MVAIIIKKITAPKWLNWIFLIVGWSMVTLIFVFKGFVYKSGIIDYGLNVTILSLGVSLILFWMHDNHHSGNEKNYRIFIWLKHMGIYSYEIYLTHMFVVIFGVQIFNHLNLSENWLIPYSLTLIFISYYLGKKIFHQFSEPVNIWLRKKWATKEIEE